MNFMVPTLAAVSAIAVVYLLLRAWAKPVLVLVLGASICLGLSMMIIPGGMTIAQKFNSIGAFNSSTVPEALIKEDRKFLNDLVHQQSQEDQLRTNPLISSGQDIAKAEGDSKPAPRAELIVNTSQVKRAHLVVNNRVVERAKMVRPGLQ